LLNAYGTNTLAYNRARCIGCGMCSIVCPHRVFTQSGSVAELAHPGRCMECGACMLNCPTGAIAVESGVGCASALMLAALTRRPETEACCGPRDEDESPGGSCCGGS
jgi:NAD-dependent dihydropyrimidine dehydrogenase PreA subunit